MLQIQNRGVKDILISSVDRLKGFPEAINAVFPDSEVELCIVHQIRNSLKYVASKNQKQFSGELKKVYQAFTKEEAEIALDKNGRIYLIDFRKKSNNCFNFCVRILY